MIVPRRETVVLEAATGRVATATGAHAVGTARAGAADTVAIEATGPTGEKEASAGDVAVDTVIATAADPAGHQLYPVKISIPAYRAKLSSTAPSSPARLTRASTPLPRTQ
jgi:hypothetical protein